MHANRRPKNQVQFIVLHVLVLAVETRCSCVCSTSHAVPQEPSNSIWESHRALHSVVAGAALEEAGHALGAVGKG